MAFMRMYGMAGDPGPRPAPKRKSAAAGPRAKAGRKRMVRAQRAARAGQGAPKGPGKRARGGGIDFGGIARGAASSAGALLGKVAHGDLAGALSQQMAGTKFAFPGKGGGGGHRRINPANAKALRRSLRRVEQFGHLVKRINKLLPRSCHYQVHPVMKHKRKRRVA